LFVHPLVAGVLDAPLAADLHVLVLVERRAPHRERQLGEQDDVVEGPRSRRRTRSGQLDLRMMHLVTREHRRRSHRRLQEAHDGVEPFVRVRAAAVARGGRLEEARPDVVEQLQVEATDVAVLEAFDELELDEIFGGHDQDPTRTVVTMEKVVYVLWRAETDSVEAFADRLTHDVADALLALDVRGLQINVADDAVTPAVIRIKELDPQMEAVVSVWLDTVMDAARQPVDEVLTLATARLAGYLVTESRS